MSCLPLPRNPGAPDSSFMNKHFKLLYIGWESECFLGVVWWGFASRKSEQDRKQLVIYLSDLACGGLLRSLWVKDMKLLNKNKTKIFAIFLGFLSPSRTTCGWVLSVSVHFSTFSIAQNKVGNLLSSLLPPFCCLVLSSLPWHSMLPSPWPQSSFPDCLPPVSSFHHVPKEYAMKHMWPNHTCLLLPSHLAFQRTRPSA